MSESEEDDVPRLSADTLKALNEFIREQELIRQNKEDPDNVNSATKFQENWQLSQFWYDEETISTLCSEICRITKPGERIALISCPSLYTNLKTLAQDREVKLFEYDKRFSQLGPDFQPYDFRRPTDVPSDCRLSFDVVVADPPFLSEDCILKTSITIKIFAKSKIILCTGGVMEELAQRLLHVKKSHFEPKHQNNLANQFYCYTNYEPSFIEHTDS